MAITGQAPPVILSDEELASLAGVDDPSAIRVRFAAPGPANQAPPRFSWRQRVARGALIAVLILAAMVPIALAVAVATP